MAVQGILVFLRHIAMQFKVPQFIDIEDKLFGPFTFKQFLYMVGGAALSYVIYRFFGIVVSILLVPPIIGLALALTFVKINNKPFVFTMEAWISFMMNKYLYGRALYIWRKEPKKKKQAVAAKEEAPSYIPKLSDSKLKDIAWGLDVLDIENK